MKRGELNWTTGLMVVFLLVGGCGTSATASPSPGAPDSIAGTYNCGPEGETAHDVVEIREDGTLTITQPGAPEPGEGTWSVEGNSGAFNPGTAEEDPFTIEGDTLVFADPGALVRFVCTPAS